MTREDEAEVLFPDADITLSSGKKVTVREIRFGESVRLGAAIAPFAEEVAKGSVDGSLDVKAVWGFMDKHPEQFFQLLSVTTGLSIAEIDELSQDDGEYLAVAFWRVNTAFFARRVAKLVATQLAPESLRMESERHESLQSWSRQATAGES